MSWSFWAFIIALIVSFFSMGLLGAVVYLFVSPVLRLIYPPMSEWTGDWVWPTNIIIGIAWTTGFLIAGAINYFLQEVVFSSISLKLIYTGVLWIWGLLIWWIALKITYKD